MAQQSSADACCCWNPPSPPEYRCEVACHQQRSYENTWHRHGRGLPQPESVPDHRWNSSAGFSAWRIIRSVVPASPVPLLCWATTGAALRKNAATSASANRAAKLPHPIKVMISCSSCGLTGRRYSFNLAGFFQIRAEKSSRNLAAPGIMSGRFWKSFRSRVSLGDISRPISEDFPKMAYAGNHPFPLYQFLRPNESQLLAFNHSI